MSYKIINPEIIKKSMMGDSEMVRQFVDMYIKQSPIDFEALEHSVGKNNKQAIRDSAHHIKPTMEYIGATALRVAFQELEDMGREEADIHLISARFREVKYDFECMIEELRLFLMENEKSL